MKRHLARLTALLGCLGVVLSILAHGETSMQEANRLIGANLYFPPDHGRWQKTSPESAGWDAQKLETVFEFARDHNSSGLILLYKGKVFASRQWQLENPPMIKGVRYRDVWYHGSNAEGWALEDVASTQKSVIAILVGIAWDKGLLDLDAPVGKYLGSGWSKATAEQEAIITVRHLLAMTSGLTEKLAFRFRAGSDWAYINKAYSLVNQVIQAATGREPNDFTGDWLTKPLGMDDTRWIVRNEFFRRWNMNGLVTSAPDLARFGLMVQARGIWDGQRIISEAYLEQMLSTSTPHNPAYGLLWWLNTPEGHRAVRGAQTTQSGKIIPSAPADLYYAAGSSDRRAFIVPGMDLLVVRTGCTWTLDKDGAPLPGFEFDRQLWKLLMAAKL